MRKHMILFLFALAVANMGVAHAASKADRIAVEARVKTELAKDLAHELAYKDVLSGRLCLDGRAVDGFEGQIVEYWTNFECPFCGISEPFQAQRDNPDICIVPRHIPASQYGESLKKAIAFEALRSFSVNAANRFWEAVVPKTALAIPVPYEAALHTALDEAAISAETFADALEKSASLVSGDILAAQNSVSVTPTYIISGIRFPACDFKATEIPHALELAQKARSGEDQAKADIAGIITRGLLDERLL